MDYPVNNGIQIIGPFAGGKATKQDMILALLVGLGCSASGYHIEGGQTTYSDRWEFFNPALVDAPDELPEPWATVYRVHHQPVRRDCVDLHFCYLHAPIEILGAYPHVPCKGIFAFTPERPDKATPEHLTASSLYHIGETIKEERRG